MITIFVLASKLSRKSTEESSEIQRGGGMPLAFAMIFDLAICLVAGLFSDSEKKAPWVRKDLEHKIHYIVVEESHKTNYPDYFLLPFNPDGIIAFKKIIPPETLFSGEEENLNEMIRRFMILLKSRESRPNDKVLRDQVNNLLDQIVYQAKHEGQNISEILKKVMIGSSFHIFICGGLLDKGEEQIDYGFNETYGKPIIFFLVARDFEDASLSFLEGFRDLGPSIWECAMVIEGKIVEVTRDPHLSNDMEDALTLAKEFGDSLIRRFFPKNSPPKVTAKPLQPDDYKPEN